MAIPSWPANLPVWPKAGTFQIQKPFREPLRTEMDEGEQAARPLVSVRVATLAYTLYVSDDQMPTLLDFIETTLNDGILKFTFPVWKAGYGNVERTVRFISTPQPAHDKDDMYNVPITIDVWDY